MRLSIDQCDESLVMKRTSTCVSHSPRILEMSSSAFFSPACLVGGVVSLFTRRELIEIELIGVRIERTECPVLCSFDTRSLKLRVINEHYHCVSISKLVDEFKGRERRENLNNCCNQLKCSRFDSSVGAHRCLCSGVVRKAIHYACLRSVIKRRS